jgi:hypothetical protein
MNDLRTEIRIYSTLREVPCVLCGRLHEQQYAAVVLFRASDQLGELCPRCLAEGPAQASARLRKHATELWARAEQKRQQESEVEARAEQVRQWVAERRAFVGELFALAERIRPIDHWPVTVSQLQEAECSALRDHSPLLDDNEVRRLVDDRYRSFLAQPA